MKRRGMFTLDALLGLCLLVAIAGALTAVVSSQRRAAIITADNRAAVRAAENVLTHLQAGHANAADATVHRIETPAPTGWMWVKATGVSGSRKAELIGLVPATGGLR